MVFTVQQVWSSCSGYYASVRFSSSSIVLERRDVNACRIVEILDLSENEVSLTDNLSISGATHIFPWTRQQLRYRVEPRFRIFSNAADEDTWVNLEALSRKLMCHDVAASGAHQAVPYI